MDVLEMVAWAKESKKILTRAFLKNLYNSLKDNIYGL
jgi:hypothetical protein